MAWERFQERRRTSKGPWPIAQRTERYWDGIRGLIPSQCRLGRSRVCSRQLRVGRRPDPLNAFAGPDKKSGRRQSYESHEERVLDQVLALLVTKEGVE